ncbi:hypothetical protein M433DRAFT_290176 [Acidomyces richmondensis BFW]|nr:MAG: hypothetical protein FE78DRAFT_444256 [Acidomyces sp. 'richmondensis']KYG44713.1 hypothetical protein M433DRAFT_290176 [Acidomyces richmondensis BFW]
MVEDFTTDLDDYTLAFPVLTKKNYLEWIDLAQDVLTSQGLWKYADGTETEPEDPSKKAEFIQNNAKAVVFLKLAAGSGIRAHLIGMHQSKEILEKIKALNDVSR